MIQPAAEDPLAAEFAQLRPYLMRVAYSHLGSLSEAEGLVQEAWLRLERTDRAPIRNLRAWMTTVVSHRGGPERHRVQPRRWPDHRHRRRAQSREARNAARRVG